MKLFNFEDQFEKDFENYSRFDEYGLRNLVSHLIKSGRDFEACRILIGNRAWREMNLLRLGNIFGYNANLNLIISRQPSETNIDLLVLLSLANQLGESSIEIYSDTDLQTLIYLGEIEKAKQYANARGANFKKVISKINIANTLIKNGINDAKVIIEETGSLVRSVIDPWERLSAFSAYINILVIADLIGQALELRFEINNVDFRSDINLLLASKCLEQDDQTTAKILFEELYKIVEYYLNIRGYSVDKNVEMLVEMANCMAENGVSHLSSKVNILSILELAEVQVENHKKQGSGGSLIRALGLLGLAHQKCQGFLQSREETIFEEAINLAIKTRRDQYGISSLVEILASVERNHQAESIIEFYEGSDSIQRSSIMGLLNVKFEKGDFVNIEKLMSKLSNKDDQEIMLNNWAVSLAKHGLFDEARSLLDKIEGFEVAANCASALAFEYAKSSQESAREKANKLFKFSQEKKVMGNQYSIYHLVALCNVTILVSAWSMEKAQELMRYINQLLNYINLYDRRNYERAAFEYCRAAILTENRQLAQKHIFNLSEIWRKDAVELLCQELVEIQQLETAIELVDQYMENYSRASDLLHIKVDLYIRANKTEIAKLEIKKLYGWMQEKAYSQLVRHLVQTGRIDEALEVITYIEDDVYRHIVGCNFAKEQISLGNMKFVHFFETAKDCLIKLEEGALKGTALRKLAGLIRESGFHDYGELKQIYELALESAKSIETRKSRIHALKSIGVELKRGGYEKWEEAFHQVILEANNVTGAEKKGEILRDLVPYLVEGNAFELAKDVVRMIPNSEFREWEWRDCAIRDYVKGIALDNRVHEALEELNERDFDEWLEIVTEWLVDSTGIEYHDLGINELTKNLVRISAWERPYWAEVNNYL
jgi:hypothetical protein